MHLKSKINRKEFEHFYFWLLFFIPLAISRTVPRMEYIGVLLRFPVVFPLFVGAIKKRNRPSFFRTKLGTTILIMLLWCLICVCIRTPRSIVSCIVDIYQMLEMAVVLSEEIRRNGKLGLKPLYYVSYVYIIFNLITILLFKNGMFISNTGSLRERAQWLFGSKNNMAIYMIVFSFIILVQDLDSKRRKIVAWIAILSASYSVMSAGEISRSFLDGSSTGIVVFVIIIFITLFFSVSQNKRRHSFAPMTIFRLEMATALINIVLLGGISIPVINYVIVNLLGKSLTFTGRIYVWMNAIDSISKSPITGYGYSVMVFSRAGATSTYNFFLGLAKSYGIPSILLIFVIVSMLNNSKNQDVQLAMVGLLCAFINGLMSQIDLKFVLFFIILIYSLENYISDSTGKTRFKSI